RVVGDAEEPGAEGRQLGPHADGEERLGQRLLDHVLPLDRGADDPRAVPVELGAHVGHHLEELLARPPELGGHGLRLVHRCHESPSKPFTKPRRGSKSRGSWPPPSRAFVPGYSSARYRWVAASSSRISSSTVATGFSSFIAPTICPTG